MPLGTIIGISMILAGVALAGGVIWQGIRYRRRLREQQRNQD